MPTPTVDDLFEIVTSTAYWMEKQLPYRVPRSPLIRVGSAALARALLSHDPEDAVGLETWCRQHVRRAIRDYLSDRFEV
jgi:DNA-directed RNA polymerase specialized sigma subunit